MSLLFPPCVALKASPSKKRCNSIAALKATSQEIVSSISQEWKDEKRDLLTEGQSFSSLDEEGKDVSLKKKGKERKKSPSDLVCIGGKDSC